MVPSGVGRKPDAGGGGGGGEGFSRSGTLADGETWTVTDSESGFGTNSLKYISLGFGAGWLYDTASIDDGFADNSDPVTSETWDYAAADGNTDRQVKAESGYRFLRTSESRMINWDTGSEITEDVFMSCTVRASATEVQVGGGSTQWKTFRIRHAKNLDGDNWNSFYSKKFIYGSEDPPDLETLEKGELTVTNDTNSTTQYGHRHPNWSNKWTREDLIANPGTVGNANGTLWTRCLDWGDTAWTSKKETLQLVFSGSAQRWRWMMVQDYHNFISGEIIDRTDFFWQRGTQARFEITDNADYSLSTRAVIQPPLTWAAGEVTLRAWKGLLSQYTGNYLHFIDGDGVATQIEQL